MIVKTSIKGNGIQSDCCNKRFTDRIMRHYEIGHLKILLYVKSVKNNYLTFQK